MQQEPAEDTYKASHGSPGGFIRGALSHPVLIALPVIAYCVLIPFGLIGEKSRLGWAEFALLAFAILYAGGFFRQIASMSFGKDGINFQLRAIEVKQSEQQSELVAIRVALTGLVSKYELNHLVQLDQPGPYMCAYGEIFFSEIKRLDSIGFLRPADANHQGFNAIASWPKDGVTRFDLKDVMVITEEGRAYLKARRMITA